MKPLTRKLQQHTPIIHFQPDQARATLRATELKPKLDRFIIKQKGDIPPEWWIGKPAGKEGALNYKLQITVSSKKVEHVDNRGGNAKGYFGNMGDAPPKHLVRNNGVKITVFSWMQDLSDFIESQLGPFFREHNFGSRKNRGFGSFTIENDTERPEKAQFAFKVYLGDEISLQGRDAPLDVVTMEVIDWFYRSLRQGINHGTFRGRFIPWLYMKPMLFQYAASKEIQWEKKTIKEWFFTGALADQQGDHTDQGPPPEPLWYASDDKRIVRDLFGLSTEQSWMNYPGKNNKPSITKEDASIKENMTPEEREKIIERFPSPLRFKPVQHPGDEFMTVYFWAEALPEVYTSAHFRIKKDGRNNNQPALRIWEGFDFSAFFEFAFEEGRLENSIRLIDHNGEDVQELLTSIYQDIRENTFYHV